MLPYSFLIQWNIILVLKIAFFIGCRGDQCVARTIMCSRGHSIWWGTTSELLESISSNKESQRVYYVRICIVFNLLADKSAAPNK